MFDEVERLQEMPELLRLLEHYARAGAADTEAWQDRLMQLDGVPPRNLVQLHGELIAHGWVQQNTGVTPAPGLGVAAACYRITAAGRRALRQAHNEQEPDDEAERAEAA